MGVFISRARQTDGKLIHDLCAKFKAQLLSKEHHGLRCVFRRQATEFKSVEARVTTVEKNCTDHKIVEMSRKLIKITD